MPLQATSGAASQDGFGGNGVPIVPAYIEEVFSTYLYTGTNAALTITNNIDLSTKGGLVWLKNRASATVPDNSLFDTARGSGFRLVTNSTAANDNFTGFAFSTSGFSLPANTRVNENAITYASWTFRKQPKFFDVVTYTGDGVARQISHSLNSVPGCIIVKRTDTTGAWQVYHSSLANTQYMVLNTTAAVATGATRWNSTTPTSTVFSLGTDATVNASAGTYVAYIFASNAAGFGLTGTDNVISCGSYTNDASGNADITLGYEPQWLLIKRTDSGGYDWFVVDTMRGWVNATGNNDYTLSANTSAAEVLDGIGNPVANGFQIRGMTPSASYIYIAIRRGPMKVPTTGTSVFNPVTYTAAASTSYSTGLSYIDLMIEKRRDSAQDGFFYDRLRGNANRLRPASTSSEVTDANSWSNQFANQGTVTTASSLGSEWQGSQVIWNMRRAPSFMDVVCYSGAGNTISVTHNLGVKPNLILIKSRNNPENWIWLTNDFTSIGGNGSGTNFIQLYGNLTNAAYNRNYSSTTYLTATPTSTTIPIGWAAADALADVNTSGWTYVAYLSATLAGVSKFGSYTGTATTLQIDCGFTAGARFVLIKRTDSTGDWYVWDTARGIVSGNDPYLLLNSTAAEVTSTDYIDTYSAGFELSSTAPAAINASGGKFIFLAIA